MMTMKTIIKIFEICGESVNMRESVRELSNKLSENVEYLFDMSSVVWMSRSAADELYNLTHGLTYDFGHIDLINMEPDAKKMYDIVTMGRYSERDHDKDDMDMIHCKTLDDFKNAMSVLVKNNEPCIG